MPCLWGNTIVSIDLYGVYYIIIHNKFLCDTGVCNWHYGAQCSASLFFEAPGREILAPSCKLRSQRACVLPCPHVRPQETGSKITSTLSSLNVRFSRSPASRASSLRSVYYSNVVGRARRCHVGWLLMVLPRVCPLLRPLNLINEKYNSFLNCLILSNCYIWNFIEIIF